MVIRREAQCPYCGQWHAVLWDQALPPGGTWWAHSTTGGCPSCGALVLVESECAFRSAPSNDVTRSVHS